MVRWICARYQRGTNPFSASRSGKQVNVYQPRRTQDDLGVRIMNIVALLDFEPKWNVSVNLLGPYLLDLSQG